MNYLIISPCGLSFFLIPHLNIEKDVEKIYFCVMDATMKHLGMGMENVSGWNKLKLVSDPFEIINKFDKNNLIVFIDDVGAGSMGNHLRNLGYRVIGGTEFTDRIEDDRQYATDLMAKIMDVPETHVFHSFDDGLSFLEGSDGSTRYVFKPHDSQVPKEYTYVAKDNADLIENMKNFQKEWKWKEDYQLQAFIEGAEVDFSAYFNGTEYLTNSMILYFENKPMMNDNVGPATGGSIAVEFGRKNEGVFFDILEKFKPYLAKVGYKGQIAVNSIVSKEDHKPYFLEFCGRVGYPSLPADLTLLEENKHTVHEFFMAMADGKDLSCFAPSIMSAVLDVDIYPGQAWHTGIEALRGEEIAWDKKYNRYFWPYFIMYDENKKSIVLTGCSAEAMNITCADKTLTGAIDMLYHNYLPTLKMRNQIYRTDLGSDAKIRIQLLRDWGVI